MIEIWVTVSKNWLRNEKWLPRILTYSPSPRIRVNLGREAPDLALEVATQLRTLGAPSGHLLLDLGNTKNRILLENSRRLCNKGDELSIGCANEGKEIMASSGVISTLQNSRYRGPIVFGDGEAVGFLSEKGEGFSIEFSEQGYLENGQSFHIPGFGLNQFELSSSERALLEEIGSQGGCGAILSFVRGAKDVIQFRSEYDWIDPVVAKIETSESINHLGEISAAADWLVLGRGDMGLDVGVERIASVQDSFMAWVRENGVRAAVGTEFLSSLISSRTPLRAEVVDIWNAIRQKVDAIMLTAETAKAADPFPMISMVRNIENAASIDLY